MPRISSKVLETKLKLGWTLSTMSNHFGQTPSEFSDNLIRIFGDTKARDYLSRFERNEKKCGTRRKPKKAVTEVPETLENSEQSVILEESVVPTEPEKTELEMLSEEHDSLEREIMSMEQTWQQHRSRGIEIRNLLISEKSNLERIRVQFLESMETCERLIKELETVKADAKQLYSGISESKAHLSELKDKIDELKKVTIFVLSSGEIEVEGREFICEAWEPLYKEFLSAENSDFDDLTRKEIKQLAKLLTYTANLDVKVEVIFDSGKLEEVFNKNK
jgi:hypothetical protein